MNTSKYPLIGIQPRFLKLSSVEKLALLSTTPQQDIVLRIIGGEVVSTDIVACSANQNATTPSEKGKNNDVEGSDR